MKLLVVTPYFYPKIGGLENYAWHIIKGLKDTYKWDCVVVTSNHTVPKYKEEIISGIKIYRLPSLFKLSNTPINPFWFIAIRNIIKKEKPDLINGHSPVPFIADIAALVARMEDVPYVLTYHNDLVKNNKIINIILKLYYKMLGETTGRLAKTIIATSDFYTRKSFFLKKFASKVKVVPPGVDLAFYKSVLPNSALTQSYKKNAIILFVGQLDKTHQHKGLSYLISSLPLVKKSIPNVKLLVIGKGDMKTDYKNQTIKLAIKNNVEFKANINNKSLVAYYKIANVVVLPTITDSEGFGMVLIEAGACKKPVIGTAIGGIPFVIKNNETGYIVPPMDSNTLSEKIIQLLNNKPLQKHFGKNGYKQSVTQFSWDKQIKKTNNFFLTL